MVRNRPVAPLRAVPVSRQSISFRSHGLQAAARASALSNFLPLESS